VLEWAREVGQEISEGETLLSVELEKIDTDVPSPATGTLVQRCVAEGDEVAVGLVVAVIET
jgi:pyruvate/2-oxoglutarate dehydrogenase complex dihydrolipoamide acyltransferase (E2) component